MSNSEHRNIVFLDREVQDKGVVDFWDDEERKIWLTIFAKALLSPDTAARDGSWVRGFATNCANFAVLALRYEDQDG